MSQPSRRTVCDYPITINHRPVPEQHTIMCTANWAESQGGECDHQGPTKGLIVSRVLKISSASRRQDHLQRIGKLRQKCAGPPETGVVKASGRQDIFMSALRALLSTNAPLEGQITDLHLSSLPLYHTERSEVISTTEVSAPPAEINRWTSK